MSGHWTDDEKRRIAMYGLCLFGHVPDVRTIETAPGHLLTEAFCPTCTGRRGVGWTPGQVLEQLILEAHEEEFTPRWRRWLRRLTTRWAAR